MSNAPDRQHLSERHVAGKMDVASFENDALALCFHALVSDAAQLAQAVGESGIVEVQIESDGIKPPAWKEAAEHCHQAGKRCVLALPAVCRTEAIAFFQRWKQELCQAGFDGFLVRSLEEPDLLKELYAEMAQAPRPPVYADHSLYVFNHLAGESLIRMGFERLTYPLELNAREMGELTEAFTRAEAVRGARMPGFELVAYGYLPVMTTAQCVRRTVSGCDSKPGFLALKDRTGRELPVYNHCAFCYNTIYNPLPLSLLGMEKPVFRLRPAALRLQFLHETPREMSEIIGAYRDAFWRQSSSARKEQSDTFLKNYTRGHMKRGVE